MNNEVKNPDLALIQRPVSKDEMAAYKEYVREVGAHRSGRSIAEQQVDGYRQAAASCLQILEKMRADDPAYAGVRHTAALALARGYGDFDQALRFAPADPEALALQAAVERGDGESCGHYQRPEQMSVVECIFSMKHQRIVTVYRCERCGFMNAR